VILFVTTIPRAGRVTWTSFIRLSANRPSGQPEKQSSTATFPTVTARTKG
jgi:hypothetical protein